MKEETCTVYPKNMDSRHDVYENRCVFQDGLINEEDHTLFDELVGDNLTEH